MSISELVLKRRFKKIKILRAQRDKFESDRIQKQLAFLKLKSFEDANKPGKWLSYRLRAQINSRQITKVKNGPTEILDENGIQQSFLKYYESLYCDHVSEERKLTDFFADLKFPLIDQTQLEVLNKPISLQEITDTIQQLKSEKAPGPDGFSGEFYKLFKSEISPYLLRVINGAVESTEPNLPETWNHA